MNKKEYTKILFKAILLYDLLPEYLVTFSDYIKKKGKPIQDSKREQVIVKDISKDDDYVKKILDLYISINQVKEYLK